MWNGEKAQDNEESMNDENGEEGVEKGMSNHKSNGTDDANVSACQIDSNRVFREKKWKSQK